MNSCIIFVQKKLKNLWRIYLNQGLNYYDLDNKIYALKFYLPNPERRKILNRDIIQYTSKYIYHIENDYVNNKFIILKSISDFCLAYLALASYRYIYDINFNENKFFFFVPNDFKNFSNFLLKYSIFSQIKDAYEKSSIPILNSAVQDRFLLLKETFDINKIFIFEENIHIDKIKSKEPQDTRKKIQNSSINHRLDNYSAKISKSVNEEKKNGKNEPSFKRNNEVNKNIQKGKIMTPKKLDNTSKKLNKNKIRNYNSEKKISETEKNKDSQENSESKEESKKDKSLNNSNQSKEKHSYTSVVKDKIEYLKIEMKIIELNINMDYPNSS